MLLSGCSWSAETELNEIEVQAIRGAVADWTAQFSESDVGMTVVIGQSEPGQQETEEWVWFGDGPMLLSTSASDFEVDGLGSMVNYMFYPAQDRMLIGGHQAERAETAPVEVDVPVNTEPLMASKEHVEQFMFWADRFTTIIPNQRLIEPEELRYRPRPISIELGGQDGDTDVFVVNISDWVIEVTTDSWNGSRVTAFGHLDDPRWTSPEESLIEVDWMIDRFPFVPDAGDDSPYSTYRDALEQDESMAPQLDQARLTFWSTPFQVRVHPEDYPLTLE